MRTAVWIGMTLVLFVSGGATCFRRDVVVPFPPPPIVFSETPTIEQLAEVVNRTDAIRELSSNSATVEVLSMPAVPKLSTTLAIQRERNFRMRANIPVLLGAGIDLGSNDEVFWFEVPEGMSKTLYYARHEQYQRQLNRSILPVDPTWIVDALGLVHIDPAQVTYGPVPNEQGQLEVRSMISMPDGQYLRVCYIEPTAGYVTHQFLFAPDERLVATSVASNHRYYAEQLCALPHRVDLQLTPSVGPPLAMRMDISSYVVNQLLSADPQQFAMPQTASNVVDLANLAPPATTTAVVPPSYYSANRMEVYPLRGTTR